MLLPRPSEPADDDPMARLRAMMSSATKPAPAPGPTPGPDHAGADSAAVVDQADDIDQPGDEQFGDDQRGNRPGLWLDIMGARWSLPATVGVAVLVLVAVVAVVLVLRAAVTTPGAPTAAPKAGTAVTIPARSGSAATSPALSPETAVPASAQVASTAISPSGQTTSPSGEVVVDVVGRVVSPGVLHLPAGSRVDDAVRGAGGATSGAALDLLNLARPLQDGEQVVVPSPGQTLAPSPTPTASAASGGGSAAVTSGSTAGASGTPVSLRTATIAELDTLPGIGPVLAQRIVDWRSAHGPFTSVDELGEVSGIGPVVLARLTPLVTL